MCVPILVDIKEIRKAFCDAHSFPNSKQIKNPGGRLYTSGDGRYDELVLDWYHEEERKTLERMTIRQKQEAAKLEHQRQVEEYRRQRDEEARIKAEEWERNAPQRKREQLEKQERERSAAVEDCKRYWIQWSNKPKLRDGEPSDDTGRAEKTS